MGHKALALGVLLVMAGCQTGGGGSFCAVSSAHRFTQGTIDAMTDEEARQEVVHNETGEKLCGWKS